MHPPTGGHHSCRFRLGLGFRLLRNRLGLRLGFGLLRNRLRLGLRLGLGRANQAVTMGPPADAVRLSIHDAR